MTQQRPRYEVGSVDDFELRKFTIVKIGNRSIGIVKTNGGFYGIANRCPHQGAPLCEGEITGTMLPSDPDTLEYGLEDAVLRCPWHGWEFMLSDGSTVGNTSRKRVKSYRVEVEGGCVYLCL